MITSPLSPAELEDLLEGYTSGAIKAVAAGCPPDQTHNFFIRGYTPQPKQLEFHSLARQVDHWQGMATPEIGYGGARGAAKSHSVFAQIALDDCQRYPGLKFLYLRKVGKSAREAFEDMRRSILWATPHIFNRAEGVLYFDNGSRIFIGNFKDESDIDKYIGIEYDGVAVEETSTLSLKKYEMLLGSVRSSKVGWVPRVYATTNPGGIGHTWFKNRFIIPARLGTETNTRFIFATWRDNKHLNPEYIQWLQSLTGWLGRAWRDGDWDIMAGMFFTTFRHEVHVIPPFEVPRSWYWWGSLDYGFVHPTVFLLFAEDGDGTIYVVAEHGESRWLPNRHTDAIGHLLMRHQLAELRKADDEPYHKITYNHLNKVVSGSDTFAQRGSPDGKTVGDQYRERGLRLSQAKTDRISGAAEVLHRLGDPDPADDGEVAVPTLYIFETCTQLIQQLPTMQHDPNSPERVLKQDIDEDGTGGDDYYDALRYGLMERKTGKQEPQQLRYAKQQHDTTHGLPHALT